MEDTYESLTLIYYKEANPSVPMARVGIEIPPIMGRSSNDNNNEMPKVMVKSIKDINS